MQPPAVTGPGAGRFVAGALVAGALVALAVAPRRPPARPVARVVLAPVVVPVPEAVEAALPVAPIVPRFDASSPISAEAAALVDEAMSALARDPSCDGTLDQIVSAVTAAPGSAKARYALACTLNRRGDELAANRQLEMLAIDGCPACSDALANLATDLGCQWRDAQRGRAPPPSPQRRATVRIAEAIATHQDSLAIAHFGRRVTHVRVCGVCDGDEADTVRARPGPRLLRDLVRRQRSADDGGEGWIHFGSRLWCEGDCCAPDLGYLSHSASFVTEVCFAPGTTAVASFSEIDGG